jgi:hypothetical protein
VIEPPGRPAANFALIASKRRRASSTVITQTNSSPPMAQVRARVAAGKMDRVEDSHPEHRHLTAGSALSELDRLRPTTEDLVACHVDYCFPTVLVGDWTPPPRGSPRGHTTMRPD